MAKNYLSSPSPQGFGKFSSSTFYKRASPGPRSISRKTHHKKVLHISKRPRPNNLPLRIKHSKMSTPPSPSLLKRTRLAEDSGHQPKKHRRISSNLVISSRIRELQTARCSSEPPTETGLEGSGILEDVTSKFKPSLITKADKDLYLRRAKAFSDSWVNRRKRALASKISSDWKEMPSSAQKGMANLTGVLCYRHSLFQALIHCPQIAHWLHIYHPKEACLTEKRANCIACHFQAVTQAYWAGNSSYLTKALEKIHEVFKTNGWSQSGQADPEEQLTWLIGRLREQLPEQTFAFFDAFTNFTLDSSTTCTKCGHVSTNCGETEGILSVELQPRIRDGNLSKYLHKYLTYSVEGYRCDECRDTSKKSRSRRIAHSPDIVILQMKRFDCLGRKDKQAIPFSSTLDLNRYRTSTNKTNSVYHLSAVVSHAGGTNGGHYRCIAKGKDECWNVFDDASMTRAKESQALDSGKGKGFTPYLLFFQRDRK